ncbi:Crp/Fnr family transcriptional regulator [Candidatus Saccharibacteria bacterium]|nr:Crp/Fnr family transcriptional regulator [Candidatus Saccharibacteria bacterium]
MSATTRAAVDKFFRQYSVKKYKKGQVLLLNNENPSRIFYLLEGRVKQYDISYRGDEIIVNTFRPYTFFPMLNAITGFDNTYCYEADTDIEVIDAPVEKVLALLREDSDVAFELLTRLYIGMDGILRRMVHMMGGSTRGRILHEILLEIRRFGTPAADGSYEVPLTEGDIASRIGLSRETVSREISKLKREKLIRMGTHIIVPDADALEAKLGKSL